MTTAACPRALLTARSRSSTVSARGVPDLLELLLGELRLERLDEARGRLARGVGDDVQLDRRMLRHAPIVADNVSAHGRAP